jgi:hypothetical protein
VTQGWEGVEIPQKQRDILNGQPLEPNSNSRVVTLNTAKSGTVDLIPPPRVLATVLTPTLSTVKLSSTLVMVPVTTFLLLK